MTRRQLQVAALIAALGLQVVAEGKIPTNSVTSGTVKRQKETSSIQSESEEEIAYEDGIYTVPDGSCVRLTVIDQGHTHVTIDAKGTLYPMKNNMIETVAVDCP